MCDRCGVMETELAADTETEADGRTGLRVIRIDPRTEVRRVQQHF